MSALALLLALLGALAWLYRMRVARNLRGAPFERLYRRAVHDVIEVLEAERAVFWLTEGTLLWALRYGRNHPPDIDDVVDDDVDVMIEVDSEAHWQALSANIVRALRRRGWSGVRRRSTSPRAGMRVDKLQVFLHGLPFQATHADFHSYIRDPANGVGRSTGDPRGYPFQRWRGALPLALVHPLRSAACYGRSAPCPRQATHILGNWDGGEYDGAPLALPLRALGSGEREILRRHALRLEAAGQSSFVRFWEQPEDRDDGARDALIRAPRD